MIKSYKKILEQNSEIYLRVKVRPGAAKTCLKEIMADETIKIDIAASAVKGKANAELIKFLAQEFGVNKNNIKIISGAGDRVKLLKMVK